MMLSLSFTPDGGKSMHALTLNASTIRVYLVGILAVLLMVTLSLVKLYEIVMAVWTFFLTASPETLARFFFLALLLIGLTCFFRYVVPEWEKARRASC